jgi:phosphoserine phosphatase
MSTAVFPELDVGMTEQSYTLVLTPAPTDAAALSPLPKQGGADDPAYLESCQASGPSEARDQLRATIAAVDPGRFDINLVARQSRKRLLIADMESTIIEQEMLDELAEYVGKRAEVETITARAMRGELDFETAITERVALLQGLDAGVLEAIMRDRLTYMPGARELVATMKAHGAYCALVSGGFTHFTAHVAHDLGFDEHRANMLEIIDGKLTGRVVPPILGRDAKLAALHELTDRLSIPAEETIAVGDGANDLAMLGAAGLGVAFRAKPQVRDAMAAAENGAVITHCDLTGLLYLQGFTSADIVGR